MLPQRRPLGFIERTSAFDHDDFVFEPKYDGFRALARIDNGRCELVSRTGVTYKRFVDLRAALPNDFACDNAIVDGEIVVLDDRGHSMVKDLMSNRRPPMFAVFDLLWLDGEDLCGQMLVERKRLLQRIIRETPARTVYVGHVETQGRALYREVCERDLEGIVAKPAVSPYRLVKGRSPWMMIRNPKYTPRAKARRRALLEKQL